MPLCKNDRKKSYKGDEPSPKGLGYCAHAEKVGVTKKGKDGNKWKIETTSKGVKRWVKQKSKLLKKNRIKKINKNVNIDNMNKYTGKIILIQLPKNVRPRYRWIVRKREDGRFIVRAPHANVLVRNLKYKRDTDFGKESLLPLGSKIYRY